MADGWAQVLTASLIHLHGTALNMNSEFSTGISCLEGGAGLVGGEGGGKRG